MKEQKLLPPQTPLEQVMSQAYPVSSRLVCAKAYEKVGDAYSCKIRTHP